MGAAEFFVVVTLCPPWPRSSGQQPHEARVWVSGTRFVSMLFDVSLAELRCRTPVNRPAMLKYHPSQNVLRVVFTPRFRLNSRRRTPSIQRTAVAFPTAIHATSHDRSTRRASTQHESEQYEADENGAKQGEQVPHPGRPSGG